MGISGISSPELGVSPGIGRVLNSRVGGFSNSGTGGVSKPRSELGLLPYTQSRGSTVPPLGSLFLCIVGF